MANVKLFTLADITVTTAATRVQVSSTATPVMDVIFTCPAANTGVIYVGDSSVSASRGIEVAKGTSISINQAFGRSAGLEYKLSNFYVDAATNGDKVKVSYVKAE
jgi:hypothetical protein